MPGTTAQVDDALKGCRGLFFQDCVNSKLIQCKLSNCFEALVLHKCQNVFISGCEFENSACGLLAPNPDIGNITSCVFSNNIRHFRGTDKAFQEKWQDANKIPEEKPETYQYNPQYFENQQNLSVDVEPEVRLIRNGNTTKIESLPDAVETLEDGDELVFSAGRFYSCFKLENKK